MGLSRNTLIATALSAAVLMSQAGHTTAATAPAEPNGSWSAIAERMAAPWPALRDKYGTFPAYNYAKASGELPYGESMLGYGLLQTGLADGDMREVHTGLRG